MTFIQDIFIQLFNMSITACYVIAAVILIRFLIKKAPKKFSYLLWSAVGFRLLCPFSFSSVFSIFNLKPFDIGSVSNGASIAYVPENITTTGSPHVSVGIPYADNIIDSAIPAEQVTGSTVQTLAGVATIVWLAGIAALILYSVISYVRLKRRVCTATKCGDNIYECDAVRSPFVLGIIRPRIYLPVSLAGEEREYILSHELYHIKRLDYVIKPVAFLILTVYWFNPLVWLAFRLMTRDMEMSCDEKVLASTDGGIKKNYSTSLLTFAVGHRFPAASPLAFGETGAKQRIRNILNFKKPKMWITAVSMLVVVGVLAACAANPRLDIASGITLDNEALEQSLVDLIFDTGTDTARPAACLAEGHHVFLVQEGESNVKVYGMMNFSAYNFMNGALSSYNGYGMSAPFVATFTNNSEYTDGIIEYPSDGDLYVKSIEEMFPTEYKDAVLNFDENDKLIAQNRKYAENYLESNGFDTEIVEASNMDVKYPDQSIFDVLQASNVPGNGNYPDFLGTQMFLEDDVWTVYSTSLNADKVYFARYANGSTSAQALVYKISNGAATRLNDETIAVGNFFDGVDSTDGISADEMTTVLFTVPDVQTSAAYNGNGNADTTAKNEPTTRKQVTDTQTTTSWNDVLNPIAMSVDKASVDSSVTELKLTVEYEGDGKEYTGGEPYWLERCAENGEWVNVEPKGEMMFTSIGWLFNSESRTHKQTVDLAGNYGTLNAGEYRIGKVFYDNDGNELTQYARFTVK